MHMRSATGRRAVALAFGPVLALLAIGWAFIVIEVRHERQLVEQAARDSAMNLATAFEAHVRSVVQQLDLALVEIRRRYAGDHLRFAASVAEVQDVYGDLVAQLSVIGSDGRLLFSSLDPNVAAVDLSDREHFRVHRDRPAEDRLFISRPVLGRVSGEWTIQFTRPLRMGDAFAGVVVLSVPTEYFSSFYGQVDVRSGGAIMVVGDDRAVRARAPDGMPRDDLMQLRLPADRPFFHNRDDHAGFYVAPSAVDGVERLGAYRYLRDYGLTVHVLLSPRDYLALHRQRATVLFVSGAALSALFLIVGYVVFCLILQHFKDLSALRLANLKLDRLARTDSLTGAMARAAFLEVAERELARVSRYGGSMSILMLDIDHFKKINDTYGHPAGDAVLQGFAERCRSSIRTCDLLGRVGGEEFAILLPQTPTSDAHVVAEKVRVAASAGPIWAGSRSIGITVSIGLATAKPNDEDLSSVWERADAALYRAKNEGRDRVATHEVNIVPRAGVHLDAAAQVQAP